jgi:hypothetical protein
VSKHADFSFFLEKRSLCTAARGKIPCAGAALRPLSPVPHEASARVHEVRARSKKCGDPLRFFVGHTHAQDPGHAQQHERCVIFIADFSFFRGKSTTKKTKNIAFSL